MEGMYNPDNIPARVVTCEESLRKWFDGPKIFVWGNAMSVDFNTGKRLRFMDEMVNSELKCKCFSRLRDAKVVKKRTFHKNISKTKQRKKNRKKLKNAKQVKSN